MGQNLSKIQFTGAHSLFMGAYDRIGNFICLELFYYEYLMAIYFIKDYFINIFSVFFSVSKIKIDDNIFCILKVHYWDLSGFPIFKILLVPGF